MDERYGRNFPALSEKEWEILHGKKIFVAGCGGIGGHVIDMLLRLGVGKIAAADGDDFDRSNLNRQLLSDVRRIGESKAKTASEHAGRVNPDTEFSCFEGFVNAENARRLITGCDAVIDALDNIASRKLMKQACDAENIPYIYGAISGWTAQAAISLPNDGLLDILYPADAAATDKSVLSFTPALCAALQVSLCVRLLCGRAPETGKLYYFDLSDMEFMTLL